MRRSVAIMLVVVLIGIVALPAMAQVPEGTADSQLQLKNHEETDPFYDGNGGINRHQTVGDPGPNGDDYGNHSKTVPDAGVFELAWIAVSSWIFSLAMLR